MLLVARRKDRHLQVFHFGYKQQQIPILGNVPYVRVACLSLSLSLSPGGKTKVMSHENDDDAASYCLAPSRALLRRRVSNVKRVLAAVAS